MTPKPAWLCSLGPLCPWQRQRRWGVITSVLLAHRDHLPSQLLPTGSQEPWWVWSLRATGVYTADVPRLAWRRRSALSSQPPCSLGHPPPYKPGTHGPPHNPSAFQRKPTPYVSDSFTLQLTMGGQRAGRLSSKPPTLIGGLESMCPLQGQELL